MLDQIETTKKALQQSHDELEIRVQDRTRELSETNAELKIEIAERVRAERELDVAHRQLIDAARRAGMAEIATGVLHNVGNVLNSVNVSATMVANQLKSTKTGQLTQVVSLLDQHQSNLGEFFANDEKGKQIPRFLKMLSEHLVKEDESLLAEAESLIANVEHIKAIVATQQTYANPGASGLAEPTEVNAILDDALRINSEAFNRHGIEVERDYADLPAVMIDKQRVMQIVINLIKNAKEALLETAGVPRVLKLCTRIDDDRLVLEVSDTGIGIQPENLTRIFAHGFTTKSSGHGFGLHSCANAATEMEGSLSASSAGPRQGATFTLKLPLRPVPVMA
jgi:C4-dicarboxylate-specific signal transduction histidine kinase